MMSEISKARAARLEALLESAVDGIIAIDSTGLIQDINPAACAMFGYAETEVIGQNIKMLMPEPYRGEHDDYLQSYLQSGERKIIGIGREVTGLRKDETIFPMELSVSEFLVGSERHFTGIIKDLTERRALEEQYNHSQRLDAIGQLTGGIAHDFNNLLTVIIGNNELLEARLTNKDDLELLQEAQEAAELGAVLTERLLAFARRQPLEPKVVDLNELVLNLSELLRRTLGEAIDLSTILASDLWRSRVDPGQVENAVLNLALNARDAMQGSGRLTVETTNTVIDDAYSAAEIGLDPGEYTLLTVSDTGSGMSAEHRERAFEPFFTTKETGRGSGLGLSMVYGFAKSSGGHASIYSERGVGTTINLFLPRDRSDIADADTGPASVTNEGGRGELILVVEDDDRVRRLSVTRLQELGYTTLEASDGPSALKVLETTPRVDMVFTDLVMPGGMSGHELIEKVKTIRPEVKVLMTSGYTEEFVRQASREGNGGAILRKPYRTADLATAIKRALES